MPRKMIPRRRMTCSTCQRHAWIALAPGYRPVCFACRRRAIRDLLTRTFGAEVARTLGQERAARALDVTAETVRRWWHGQAFPRWRNLERLAHMDDMRATEDIATIREP